MAWRSYPACATANVSVENPHWPPSARELRAAFDGIPPYTVGIEDEVMLLSPDSFELLPVAPRILALLGDDRRFKLELPASQIEIVTAGSQDAAAATMSLLEGRRVLAEKTGNVARLAAAGVHPFSSGAGELNRLPRYEPTIREFGRVAERQQVCALQVHVSAGDADRALAVYNAARSYLPLIAAVAANAPYYEGCDTGLASVRPKLGQLLPRQGIPPPIASWQVLADILRWGATTGSFATAQTWWWELRLHPSFGTLEFRVPDSQSTVADAEAIAVIVQALVAWLGDRHDGGDRLPVHSCWQIEENRWSACRYGVEGQMVELETAMRLSTRSLLHRLLDTLEPVAARLRSDPALRHAREMVAINGAIAQRRVAHNRGTRAVAQWLVERFLEPR
jgi:carboxylate-amine ligase